MMRKSFFVVALFSGYLGLGQGVTQKEVYFNIFEYRSYDLHELTGVQIKTTAAFGGESVSFRGNMVAIKVPANISNYIPIGSADPRYRLILPEGGKAVLAADNLLEPSQVILQNVNSKAGIKVVKGIIMLKEMGEIDADKMYELTSKTNAKDSIRDKNVHEVSEQIKVSPDTLARRLADLERGGFYENKMKSADFSFWAAFYLTQNRELYLRDIENVNSVIEQKLNGRDFIVTRTVLLGMKRFLINPWDSVTGTPDVNSFYYHMSQFINSGLLSPNGQYLKSDRERYHYLPLYSSQARDSSVAYILNAQRLLVKTGKEELSMNEDHDFIKFQKSMLRVARKSPSIRNLYPKLYRLLLARGVFTRAQTIEALGQDMAHGVRNCFNTLQFLMNHEAEHLSWDSSFIDQVDLINAVAEAWTSARNFSDLIDELATPSNSYLIKDPSLQQKLNLLGQLKKEIYFTVLNNRGHSNSKWIDNYQFASLGSVGRNYYTALVYKHNPTLLDALQLHGRVRRNHPSLTSLMKNNTHTFVTYMQKLADTFSSVDQSRPATGNSLSYRLNTLSALRTGLGLMDFNTFYPRFSSDEELDFLSMQMLSNEVDPNKKLENYYRLFEHELRAGITQKGSVQAKILTQLQRANASILSYLEPSYAVSLSHHTQPSH